MPEAWASEPTLSLVPYEDGCVTPLQPSSITQARAGVVELRLGLPLTLDSHAPYTTQVSTELTVMLTKTTTAAVSALPTPLAFACSVVHPSCYPQQVSETRVLLLKLMGSDPQALPAQAVTLCIQAVTLCDPGCNPM